ncbi:hypothetical protein D3C71_1541870 [compost metagenome]
MQPGAQPRSDLGRAQRLGQRVLGHHGAVGQVARHPGRRGAEQLCARAAPEAVGADERIPLHLFAPTGAHRDDAVGIDETLDRLVKMQLGLGAVRHRGQQQAMQIGAVDGGIGGAIPLDRRGPQWHGAQFFAADGIAHLQARGKRRHGLQRLLQSPGLQPPHHIGPDLHARTHFAERGGPFVQPHIQSRTRRTQGRRQAANATASDQHLFLHHRAVSR